MTRSAYDGIVPPSEEEQRLINGILKRWDEGTLRAAAGVKRWANGMAGEQLLLHYLYDTTIKVAGLTAGYGGPGPKAILPARATAKLDSRLVPNQDPKTAFKLIESHLAARGFSDVTLRFNYGYPSSRTSVTAGIVQATISVLNKYAPGLTVWPRHAGSAPFYQFTERLGLPFAFTGLGHGGKQHAPNEYLVLTPVPASRIVGLAGIERSYVDMLHAFASRGTHGAT